MNGSNENYEYISSQSPKKIFFRNRLKFIKCVEFKIIS